jgi:hypothetical protein
MCGVLLFKNGSNYHNKPKLAYRTPWTQINGKQLIEQNPFPFYIDW